MSIVINNISKSFGELQALKEVSFSTSEGEIFGLIGPDGAGKTTLFRILVTLLLADEGNASIAGFDVEKDMKRIREIIGYMPGKFSLYQDLSVRENLEFYATVFGTTIEENYDLVKDIYEHIEPFEDRLAGKLSGGMKQKLALSCSLIHRPKVLVLDEPTTGVDAVSRKEFWDMLKKIAKQGITVLVSTPYMDEAELCDRVALIQKGEILTVSEPSALTLGEGVKLFGFQTSGSIYEYLQKIRDIDDCIKAWLFGDSIHVFVPEEFGSVIFRNKIEEMSVPDLQLDELQPGVEDYFMQVSN